MNNLKQSRHGFRFEVQNGEPSAEDIASNRRNLVIFEVKYLAGSQRKGVVASLRHTTIEQREGYHMESFSVFGAGNISTWVKVLARKSDKEVVKMAELLDSRAPEIVSAFIQSADLGKAALQAAVAEVSI